MTNILVECPDLTASVILGVLNSLESYRKNNMCNVKFIKTISIKTADICWSDIMICVRGFGAVTFELVKFAKNNGRFIIYFLDDNLLNLPPDIESAKYFTDEMKVTMEKILSLADVFWCVNPLIGEIYKKYISTERVVLSKICVNTEKKENRSRQSEKINILYAGSTDHKALINDYIVPAVKNLISKYPDQLTFTFIGANPDIRPCEQIICKSFFYDYEKYCDYIRNGNFILGLAPIKTTQFYQCKYINKFIEYTRFGITGIYTDTMPYNSVVHSGENGYLTENSAQEWERAIENAIKNLEITYLCADNAIALLEKEFTAEAVSSKLLNEIPELLTYKAPAIKVRKKIKNPRIIFFCDRCKFYWRKNHFSAPFIILAKSIKVASIKLFQGGKSIVERIFQRNI